MQCLDQGGITIIIEHIYITYSPERSVEYCFWKYFFQVSGIWVFEEVIRENWEIDYTKTPQLVILGKDDKGRYGTEYPRIVYCIKKPKGSRRDLVKPEWWDGYYHNVLEQLFYRDRKLLSFLHVMIDIFAGEFRDNSREKSSSGLWSTVWFFHEIAQAAKRADWDQRIDKEAASVETLLERKGKDSSVGWYYQYARLYCEYMRYGVNRSVMTRMRWGESLLEKCRELARISGWSPSLSLLAARISLLTSTQNKYAVTYFQNILNQEVRAEIFYEIGRIYEKAYGNEKLAWKYYHMAYSKEPDYYRAVYKIAAELELEGDWIRSLGTYNQVRKIIARMRVKHSISIRDLEYEYKSCKRIYGLSRRHINDMEFQNDLRGHIVDMCENPGNYINFDKLSKFMFAKEDQAQKKQEIMEELRKKLNEECYY